VPRASSRVLATAVGLFFAAAAAAGTNGTWFGKLKDPDVPEQPLSDLSPGKLVVTATTAVIAFTGITSATHDPPDATSTCTSVYRFAAVQDGWRVFRQKGRSKITGPGAAGGGAPVGGACSTIGGAALRLRQAGAKLKVQWVGLYDAHDPDSFVGANSGYFRR
jgi:hypothetical protein